MTFLLKKTPIFDICKQFSALRTSRLSTSITKSSLEQCQEHAKKIQRANGIRTRCMWAKEEDVRLLQLFEKEGPRWTFISQHFVDRSPVVCRSRILLLKNQGDMGPWSQQEIEALLKLCEGKRYKEIDDWKKIQNGLPHPRPLTLIQLKYRTLDPFFTRGRWTQEEKEALENCVMSLDYDWERVSDYVGTRSPIQCRERWVWQQRSITKGRFTPDEDAKIIEAVKKYGLNFGVICKVIGTDRTPRHVSQHYHYMLDPNRDQSPWTEEEKELVYQTWVKVGSMKKTKEVLGSKRPLREMWNRVLLLKKKKQIK